MSSRSENYIFDDIKPAEQVRAENPPPEASKGVERVGDNYWEYRVHGASPELSAQLVQAQAMYSLADSIDAAVAAGLPALKSLSLMLRDPGVAASFMRQYDMIRANLEAADYEAERRNADAQFQSALEKIQQKMPSNRKGPLS